MRAWTNEEIDYLKSIYVEKFNDEIADMMNDHFKGKYRKYTPGSISSAKDRLNIHSKPVYGRLYRKEVIEFIQCNYKGKDNLELAELLNEKFNLNTTADKVSMLKVNLKRRFGINVQTGINKGCYKKGNIPINKGTKGMFNVGGNRTSFKKGNKSWNCDPIGTEKWKSQTKNDKEGFLYVKVQDGHKQHNWKQKHRLLWEQAYGEIPEGYKVIFKDGNRHNIVLENLALVSDSQMLILNQHDLIYKEKELTEVGINIAKVIDKANEKARK